MTGAEYYGLIIVTTLCSGSADHCLDFNSSFIQEEPFYTIDKDRNQKWCNDSKTFVVEEMEKVFPGYTIKSMECSFKVIPYLSKEMQEKING